ncbi:MAG: hypothetical protein JWL86_3812 [Rhizobium sp.]|nr:hypothetical protein [Rhizobium sp.]
MLIDPADEQMLLTVIGEGNAVLFLGAGASATSTTQIGKPVMMASTLAAKLASMAGLTYADEDLTEVLSAVVGPRVSTGTFHELLKTEYTKTKPAKELEDIFSFSWRRIYSWNIDDAVENVRTGVQSRRYFNGLIDRVSAYEGLEFLQVIHLHGEALKPEHGFIFSSAQYNERLNQDTHDWYRQAASDYVLHSPIFIGSRLKEPILSAELDRARPNPDAGLGLAFLITPDKFSQIQMQGLRHEISLLYLAH